MNEPRPNLTDRQAECYRILVTAFNSGTIPTQQELGETMDVNKVTVFGYLDSLEKKGYIERNKYKRQSIKPTAPVDLRYAEQGVTVNRSDLVLAITLAAAGKLKPNHRQALQRLEKALDK